MKDLLLLFVIVIAEPVGKANTKVLVFFNNRDYK